MKIAYRQQIIFLAIIFNLFSLATKSIAPAGVVVFPLEDQFYVIPTNRGDGDGEVLPDCLVIDWEATWNCSLRYDFDFEDGFVFNKNW